ncbi:hypothetical protein SAMN05428987_1392 [Paenibacillus sp. CF095]|uniref:hypothetical protein n=1 Tax=Paenibacillus sp. CF095 TaxID=1881033 RepID=UPI00088ECDAA|nr:hypothetical protein [Paenibacillus sp. CF095]SDC45769.1 hypothetical protein SAMN05428987_1392 [Paenibacillus sp. CF095]
MRGGITYVFRYFLLIGLVLCYLIPFGPIVAGGIIFALVVDQYRHTMHMREDIRDIKNHLGLMNKGEAQEYELDQEYTQVDRLDAEEMNMINRRIEAELEKESKKQ